MYVPTTAVASLLLLVFLMLSSTFSPFPDLSLSHIASERQGAKVQSPSPIFLRVAPASLQFNRDDVPSFDLTTRVAALGHGDILVPLQESINSQRLIDGLARLNALEVQRVTVMK